ncbi:type II toxin-antitoxin system RelE/ParE family toxin [Eubacterium sp.]|uniref:type II toxin-antitoxin system RelE/ParE family toxin n=1 Tax=Eubacterium sp. TaxID=142586 RepID=UPI0026E109DA|nr:type II toxin-antitoxin system RelE/ParE family toxin [Eubacterium sp.]MDO5434719.1 type II toxin-antitoxin system RelE/ParE family toxin [Eubacterium sp.]
MKSYEVIVTDAAQKDIERIWRYIRTELLEPEAAKAFRKKLKSEILKLGQMPARHSAYKKEPWAKRGLRFFKTGHFLTFFIILESEQQVYVLRTVYEKRNLDDMWH